MIRSPEAETALLTTSNGFPVAICPSWQVAYDKLQWILQHWRAPRWRDRAFCRTRSGLEQCIGELVGREFSSAVAHLPDWHPDVDGVPEPRRLANGKLDLRSSKGTSTLARGQMIRDQILAQCQIQLPSTCRQHDNACLVGDWQRREEDRWRCFVVGSKLRGQG